MKKLVIALLIALVAGSVAACSGEETGESNVVTETGNDETTKENADTSGEINSEESGIELMHIHGLGFSGDGSGLYVPSHDGLKVFQNGSWSEAEVEENDYMGFSMVDDGFYSSGHPGPESSLENPFGIVKSTDMGETLEKLDLYKEVDFHGMAVGYNSHAIYVINPQPNSRMDQTGLFYSTDDTKTWSRSEMTGLQGSIFSIAAHPTDEGTVALGTEEGAFLSTDHGQSFDELSNSPTTAVAFTPAGELVAGNVSDEVALTIFEGETKEPKNFSIPSIEQENAISYIAVNPEDENHISFSTSNKDIYETRNAGESWNQIAEQGTGLDLESIED